MKKLILLAITLGALAACSDLSVKGIAPAESSSLSSVTTSSGTSSSVETSSSATSAFFPAAILGGWVVDSSYGSYAGGYSDSTIFTFSADGSFWYVEKGCKMLGHGTGNATQLNLVIDYQAGPNCYSGLVQDSLRAAGDSTWVNRWVIKSGRLSLTDSSNHGDTADYVMQATAPTTRPNVSRVAIPIPTVSTTLAVSPDYTTGSLALDDTLNYKVEVVTGQVYTVSWDDLTSGNGTYTAYLKVNAFSATGYDYWDGYMDYGSNGYTFTATTSTIYLKVNGYKMNTSPTHTFAIKIDGPVPSTSSSSQVTSSSSSSGPLLNPLDLMGTWLLDSAGGDYVSYYVYFTFDGNGQYWYSYGGCDEVGTYTTDGGILATVSDTATGQGCGKITTTPWTKTWSVTQAKSRLFLGDTVGATTFNPMVFFSSTTRTRPAMTHTYVDSITVGAAWAPGNIAGADTMEYKIHVTAGTSYTLYWDDSYDGSAYYTTDVKVRAFSDAGVDIWGGDHDSGYTGWTVVPPTDLLIVKVYRYNNSIIAGDFGIKITQP